jgi:hypothetical protein
MISFDPSKPVVLFLTGKAGTGKSTLAGGIAPPISSSFITEKDDYHPIHWHEYSITPPLQALYAARTRVEGENALERQKYEILKTLLDVFNHSPLYGAPPFDALVSMVQQIMMINTNSDQAFMVQARLLLESHDPDVLYKNLERAINNRLLKYKSDVLRELEDLEEEYPDRAFNPKLFGVVLPDVSSDEEWNYIRNAFDNTMVIELQCDEDIRLERLDEDSVEVWRVPLTSDRMFFLNTNTKVERMLLNGDPLPVTDDDNRRGKKKGIERCTERLKREEFQDLLTRFRSIFQTESSTYAQDQ